MEETLLEHMRKNPAERKALQESVEYAVKIRKSVKRE